MYGPTKVFLRQMSDDIRRAAKDRDWNTGDLAYFSKLSYTTCRKVMLKKRWEFKLTTLIKLAKAVDMDVALLMEGLSEAMGQPISEKTSKELAEMMGKIVK